MRIRCLSPVPTVIRIDYPNRLMKSSHIVKIVAMIIVDLYKFVGLSCQNSSVDIDSVQRRRKTICQQNCGPGDERSHQCMSLCFAGQILQKCPLNLSTLWTSVAIEFMKPTTTNFNFYFVRLQVSSRLNVGPSSPFTPANTTPVVSMRHSWSQPWNPRS